MFSTKLSVVPVTSPSTAALVACALLLTACSTPVKDPTAAWSPNKIYSEARDEANSGAYDKAIPLFEKLEGRAAGTPLAQQAQLEKAYAQYKGGEQAQALATLDRFIKSHPSSPAVDYALYLKGLVNFNENLGLFSFIYRQDLSERDQKAAKESFESFKELVNRFPDSKYSVDGRARMVYIVNLLAQYEVHVARYYYNRGAYVSALNRAQLAITDYQDVPILEEAVFLLYKSYDALGMTQLRDDAKRVLETTYPQSEYLTKGFKSVNAPWYRFW
ncbi:MAG TPA: outer membrane protein assembly factor BamD [Polaromonas sp.]|uniref:outer membrane protein assembly factor BamD n=1 Tax=Polaromonas sp. TaxID=1869339 RepID=UPI002D43F89D|nr:outer membrane protein assembly factor BamD [Polaromonas sp.]HYW57900.1 outer membrane protein assembly factor BamD [Polaromonas sp.]